MRRSRTRSRTFGAKAPPQPMSDQRRMEVVAQFTDDVLSKLADAFFQVVKQEGWGKRDLSLISGINETAINHVLAGRRKNLTAETIALLTRAMRTRPELILHDLRPTGNNISAAAATDKQQVPQVADAAKSVALAINAVSLSSGAPVIGKSTPVPTQPRRVGIIGTIRELEGTLANEAY
jgi:hypothetical protein